MNDSLYAYLAILVCGLVTMAIRALPHLVFRGRELPPLMHFLGEKFAPAIMVLLVVYCLRGIRFTAAPYAIPELVGAAVIVLMQLWKRNTLLSVGLGAGCYLLLQYLL